jgi:DNA-binding CsgD family transcriptional regulator
MIALGLPNDEIGRRLGVTVHAVKFHLASIYRKLHVANRTQAAAAFLQAAGAARLSAGGETA